MPIIITKGLGLEATPGGAFTLTAISATPGLVTVTLSNSFIISGPAADSSMYVINGVTPGAYPVTPTGVSVLGSNLLITTTEMTDGETYQLIIPNVGIVSVLNEPFQGIFNPTFTGAGTRPFIVISRSIDARIVEVVYNERVIVSDATNPANYSITPGPLAVTSVDSLTEMTYRLHTAKQTDGTLYTIVVSNVRDIAGNLS